MGNGCNQWKAKKWDVGVTMVNKKRGIAAGHARVVDYFSSRISAKVSCSLALPSPDNFFVCANSQRLFFCSTQVSSPKIKYNLIFLYTYVFTVYNTMRTAFQGFKNYIKKRMINPNTQSSICEIRPDRKPSKTRR